jgi:hypothetical protein
MFGQDPSQSQRPPSTLLLEAKRPGQPLFSVNKDLVKGIDFIGLVDGKGPSTRENVVPRKLPWEQKGSSEDLTPEQWEAKRVTRMFWSLLDESNDLCWQGQERVLTKCPYFKIIEWTWKPTGRTGQTNVPCEGRWCPNCQPVIAKRLTERAWRHELFLYQTVRSHKVWRSYRDKLAYKEHSYLRVPQADGTSIVFTTRCDGTKLRPSHYFDAIWEALKTSPPGTRLAYSDDLRPPPREHDPNLTAVIVGQCHPLHPLDREVLNAIIKGATS